MSDGKLMKESQRGSSGWFKCYKKGEMDNDVKMWFRLQHGLKEKQKDEFHKFRGSHCYMAAHEDTSMITE